MKYIYSAKVLVTSAISLTEPVHTIDGVTLKQYDYILLNGQNDTKENGVYMVNADNTLTRSSDFLLFGPHFENFEVKIIAGPYVNQYYSLRVPLGSDFNNVSQVWVLDESVHDEDSE
jgi:hypothetical protein